MAVVKTKHSTSPGSVPSGLTSGELAVNISDRRIFIGSAGGAVDITGVRTFNGLTGDVSGVTTSVANTFTALQTFDSGISAAGATFGSDITVNGVRVGRGGGNVSSNTVLGSSALGANITGTQNVAIGIQALNGATNAGANIAIGRRALFTTTAGDNVGIGNNAANNLTSGSENVYIGSGVAANSGSSQNEIVIGANTTGRGSNTVTIGNSSVVTTFVSGVLNASSGITASGATFTGNINCNGNIIAALGNIQSNYYTPVGVSDVYHSNIGGWIYLGDGDGVNNGYYIGISDTDEQAIINVSNLDLAIGLEQQGKVLTCTNNTGKAVWGLPPAPVHYSGSSNAYYIFPWNATSWTSTAASADNTLVYYFPLNLQSTVQIRPAFASTASAPGSTGSVYLKVFNADRATGKPTGYSIGTFNNITIQANTNSIFVSAAPGLTLDAGFYWIGVNFQNNTTNLRRGTFTTTHTAFPHTFGIITPAGTPTYFYNFSETVSAGSGVPSTVGTLSENLSNAAAFTPFPAFRIV